MTSFNQSVRIRLDKKLRKKQFMASDFDDLVEAHDVTRKARDTQIYRMVRKNLLRIVDEANGKNVYEVVPDAVFDVMTNTERVALHRERVTAQEKKLATCAKMLDKAMAGWV